jgi:Phage Terminase
MSLLAIERAFGPRLLGAALGDMASWATWLTVLKAAFGRPLAEAELRVFTSVAGDRSPPTSRVRELWCVCGRRSGKSRMAAAVAVYQALFVPHRLARGEVGMVLVLAASQAQAKTVFSYIRGFLDAAPALAREVVAVTRESIELKNGVVIAVHSNSFRTIRGRTVLAAILDEIAYWRDESSATPDSETYSAILPALATTNGMFLAISTPYRKLGLLHQKHRDHFGVDDAGVLVRARSVPGLQSVVERRGDCGAACGRPDCGRCRVGRDFSRRHLRFSR